MQEALITDAHQQRRRHTEARPRRGLRAARISTPWRRSKTQPKVRRGAGTPRRVLDKRPNVDVAEAQEE
jgi:hypothetical protein